jgi:aminopeptidase N
MKPLRLGAFLLTLLAAPAAHAATPGPVQHDIHATLEPRAHAITVTDHVTVPQELVAADGAVRFVLDAGMTVQAADPRLPVAETHGNAALAPRPGVPAPGRYRIYLPPGQSTFTLTYSGTVFAPPGRGGVDTPGLIDEEGALLSGASRWYPQVQGPDDTGNALVAFQLTTEVPAAWEVVSQGDRLADGTEDERRTVTWAEGHPQDEIYLVAGPYTEYDQPGGPAFSMVFLREPDEALAERYLTPTTTYIARYSRLIGPYPYAKFALVENRWETGFGMPSFTLMGPGVIRLPFIVDTSYPHEILHNWWGNGVFLDPAGGNWAEGLTAYLADHLMRERKGQGAAYRREALQRYADFVKAGRDFPLAQFTARHGEVSQSVGYDKGLMLFHMLRRRMGDDAFRAALRAFYREKKFTRAGFGDVEAVFSRAAATDLHAVFGQWLNRTGAPALAVDPVRADPEGNGYRLSLTLRQTQDGAPYRLRVPLAVTLTGRPRAVWRHVDVTSKVTPVVLSLPARPLWLEVDPEFDLFRRLAIEETPPALSGLFGAEKVLFVLPSKASDEALYGYGRLADAWRNLAEGTARTVLDDELTTLPSDGTAVWLLGWNNRFRRQALAALAAQADVMLTDSGVLLPGGPVPIADHALVFAARQKGGAPLGWIAADNPASLPGLARKLPHYGKYGFLAFAGPRPDNVLKGQWAVRNSPLTVPVAQPDEHPVPDAPAPPEARPPLVP